MHTEKHARTHTHTHTHTHRGLFGWWLLSGALAMIIAYPAWLWDRSQYELDRALDALEGMFECLLRFEVFI